MSLVPTRPGDLDAYYAVLCRLDGRECYFIWYSGEPDGVVLSAPHHVAVFASQSDLQAHATAGALKIEPEGETVYDFDQLSEWLEAPRRDAVNCSFLLNAWNMLSDVARSVAIDLPEPQGANSVYDKLFWGCNLPAVTPPGKEFEPMWSEEEVQIMNAVLSHGLGILRKAVRHAS